MGFTVKHLIFASILLLVQGCSQDSTQISGTLVGHDGQTLRLGHVALYPSISEFWLPKEPPVAIQSVPVGTDGSFQLSTDTTGIFTLVFSGVNHDPKEILLLLSETAQNIELDIQLATHDYRSDFSEIAVIGDFNGFADRTSKPMDPQADGTFVAKIETKGDTLAYQLINVLHGQGRMHGTQFDRFHPRDRGHYASVLDVEEGIVRITFDPDKLVVSKIRPTVTFRNESSEVAMLAAFVHEVQDEIETYSQRLENMKEDGASETELAFFINEYDWSQNHGALDQVLNMDTSLLLKQAAAVLYLVQYRNFQSATFKFHGEADGNFMTPELILRAFQKVDVKSPLWSAWPDAFRSLSWANYKNVIDGYEPYFKELLNQNPDALLKAFLLDYELVIAKYAGDEERSTSLYYRLVTEYPDSKEAEHAKQAYGPDRVIQAGNSVPNFRVPSLQNPNVFYSNESLKGSTYLVDFWGTWCGPCIGEMPYMHEAYKKYKHLGFTILSLACDESPGKVIEFRAGEWGMPWLHSFLPDCYGSGGNDLLKTFGVIGFPTAVLVGRDQRILANGRELSEESLDETLSRVFSKQKNLSQK